jgi:predicted regulator of Ras-like GTPase activity (Roadblock/LC7/MglB family)
MSELYTAAVERLSRISGVRGALLVDSEAAVPVIAELSEGVNGTALAALTASLFRRVAQASERARFCGLTTMQLEAEDGYIVAVGAGQAQELILVAVAEHDAQLGMVRVEALRAAESLS